MSLVLCAIFLCAFTNTACWTAGTDDKVDSWAVLVNMDGLSATPLPKVDGPSCRPAVLVKRFRSMGLRVATDPTGQIVAASAPSQLLQDVSQYPSLSNTALAAVIVQHTTMEQLALQNKGFVSLEALPQSQASVVGEIAQRLGFVASNKTSPAKAHAVLGIAGRWIVFVTMVGEGGKTICRRLDMSPSLPTEGVIESPALRGSPLWFSWSEYGTTWVAQRVDIPTGMYTVKELLSRLSSDNITFNTPPSVGDIQVSVAASQARIRDVLWAIEAATGLQIEMTAGSAISIDTLYPTGSQQPSKNASHAPLAPIAKIGYYAPAFSPVGPLLLSAAGDASSNAGSDWCVWKLADLPLLYQNEIRDIWNVTAKGLQERETTLNPEKSFVIWTGAVLVNIEAQSSGGGGQGIEFVFPAL